MPTVPFLLGDEQVVSNIAEKLDLHDMDLLDRDARNLSPRLIRVGIIVKNCEGSVRFSHHQIEIAVHRTLVSHHQGDGHQPEFTPFLASNAGIEFFQAIYEHQSQ